MLRLGDISGARKSWQIGQPHAPAQVARQGQSEVAEPTPELLLVLGLGPHARLHLDRQVANVVNELAPQLPPLPPPLVGSIGAESEQHAEDETEKALKLSAYGRGV